MNEFSAELIGTMLLILLGTGVVANVVLKGTKGNNAGWMVITTGWALAVFVGVVIAAPYSGAHLNPAVTIALALAGKFAWSKVAVYIVAQLLGAILGALLMWVVYRDHFNATSDPDAQLAVFSTAPAIQNRLFNLLSEIIGTFVLILVIFYFTGAEMGEDKTPVGLGSLGALPVAFLVWAIGTGPGTKNCPCFSADQGKRKFKLEICLGTHNRTIYWWSLGSITLPVPLRLTSRNI
jgi:glycerol uptake facilitator protein